MTAVPPPTGAPTADDKQWSMLSWVGVIVLGFVGPLIVMLTKGKESQFVKANATEALNFGIMMLFWWIAVLLLSAVTCGIGAILVLAPIGATIAFGIIGAMKTNQGEIYMCPLNFFRLVK